MTARVPEVSTLNDYPVLKESLPLGPLRCRRYRVDFARDRQDLDEILKMRFEVFNLELGEGLDASYATGRDQDDYDLNCHHLRVLDDSSGRVVGTYRLQTSAMAARFKGFYSSDEFDLGGLPADLIENGVEVGRACVTRDHRNGQALFMLWKGLAAYMVRNDKRYLFGCCSIASQSPRVGLGVMAYLKHAGHLHETLRVQPQPGYRCFADGLLPANGDDVDIPSLFRSYLRYGGKVCGPPAIDRLFRTIDFFVLFDVAQMDARARRMFFDEFAGGS